MKRMTIRKKMKNAKACPAAPPPEPPPGVDEDTTPREEIPEGEAVPSPEDALLDLNPVDESVSASEMAAETQDSEPSGPHDDAAAEMPASTPTCEKCAERVGTGLDGIADGLAGMSREMNEMAGLAQAAATLTELNKTLSRRVRELEDREYRENTLLPLLEEFIQAIDAIDLERQNVPAGASAAAYEARYCSLMDCFDERFTAVLARYGLTALPVPPPGSPFDSATQDVVRVEKVRAPMDSIVTGSPRRGYADGARVHRATGVVVQKTTTNQEEV